MRSGIVVALLHRETDGYFGYDRLPQVPPLP